MIYMHVIYACYICLLYIHDSYIYMLYIMTFFKFLGPKKRPHFFFGGGTLMAAPWMRVCCSNRSLSTCCRQYLTRTLSTRTHYADSQKGACRSLVINKNVPCELNTHVINKNVLTRMLSTRTLIGTCLIQLYIFLTMTT